MLGDIRDLLHRYRDTDLPPAAAVGQNLAPQAEDDLRDINSACPTWITAKGSSSGLREQVVGVPDPAIDDLMS